MKTYWFENWERGQMVDIRVCQANSVYEAVSQLSDQFKGVFLLVGSQTEVQRVKENWQEFERVGGET